MACWNTKIETLSNGKIYIKSGDRSNSYYGKFWVAKITGTDQKWGLKREFVNEKDGAVISEDGVYQVFRSCQWAKQPEDYFLKVSINDTTAENDYETISKSSVLSMF